MVDIKAAVFCLQPKASFAMASREKSAKAELAEPKISRSLTLRFVGDWGQANFHRICSVLSQEFCERAGPRSRVCIWNIRAGGIEAIHEVQDGAVDLAIATPASVVARAVSTHAATIASSRLYPQALPSLRALAVMPQNDCIIMALHPKFGISSFEELRLKKPALRLATCYDDGTSFIGHVAFEYLAAHGIPKETIESWGGSFLLEHNPIKTLEAVLNGEADALLQEAIMTPWWREIIEQKGYIPLQIEKEALSQVDTQVGLQPSKIPAGYWSTLKDDLSTLSFADFVVLVRDDMPEDVAYLLTWCMVERRLEFERPYHHIPPERSPLSYPLIPEKMADSPLALHPAARRFYKERGYL